MRGLLGGLVEAWPSQVRPALGITLHGSSRLLTTAWGCSDNNISDAGAASLGEAIKHLSSLQSLDVRYVGCCSESLFSGGGIGVVARGACIRRSRWQACGMLCGECVQ